MSQAAYPTTAQVADFLESQGFDPAPAGMNDHLLGAIAEWESRTGYKPFLGDSVATSWYFDAPFPGSAILDLQGGFWAITSVATGITYDDDTGTALTLNQDYLVSPMNAANESRGWDQIRFLSSAPTGTRCIKIVGKRGYAEELPEDVWLAIRNKAAAAALYEATQGFSGTRSLQQGPVKIEYDVEAGSSKHDVWSKGFNSAVLRYKRI